MRGPVITVTQTDAGRLLPGLPWPAWAPETPPQQPLVLFVGWEVVSHAGTAQVALWRAQLVELALRGWHIRERQDGRRWGLVVVLTPPGASPPPLPVGAATPRRRPPASR